MLKNSDLSQMATDIPTTVLVVDDDENQRWMVKTYLRKHGFTVLTADGGEAMREKISANHVEIVLLDVSMPGEDGFTLARYLREHHKVGIIMLTASADLLDRVLGLEIGADDYVTKPFEPRELLARVKALVRRTVGSDGADFPLSGSGSAQGSKVSVALGEFLLNLETRELQDKNGGTIGVTSMEFDLLKAFADNPGKVLTRDKLLQIAHKGTWDPFDRSVDNRIGRVRKKIEKDPSKPELIKTVRGVGYIYASENEN
ncbi:MAG: response regulator [Granulosicoccus sp.]|nr:response regulator [Granulosicoccus sp.]